VEQLSRNPPRFYRTRKLINDHKLSSLNSILSKFNPVDAQSISAVAILSKLHQLLTSNKVSHLQFRRIPLNRLCMTCMPSQSHHPRFNLPVTNTRIVTTRFDTVKPCPSFWLFHMFLSLQPSNALQQYETARACW